MNRSERIHNGSLKYETQSALQTIKSNSNQWAYGKIKPAQPYLYRKLVHNEILKNLSESMLREIFPLMDLIYFDTGEYIYQPDDTINYLYFPESAIVSEFQMLEDGKTMEVAMTGREGMIGISTVFNSHSSPNWQQVSISGKALRIDSKIFKTKFNNSETLQKLLFQYINLYIAQISQKVICSSHHSVEERLCCWLLMISDRCGLSSLPLTQEQIAGFLGVHRPSITLITQSLREKGIINYLRGKISILDRIKLQHSSCDCYAATKAA